MDGNSYFEQLYRKFLEGYASKRELRELLEHFEQEGSNSPLIEQIREQLNSGDETDHELDRRADQLIAESDAVIYEAIKRKGITRSNWLIWSLTAAALLATGMTAFYIIRSNNPQSPVLTSIYGDDVAPGGNRAMITLSDGSTTQLSEDQQEVVITGQEFTYGDGNRILSAGQEIKSATIRTPRGGQYRLTLPDGSKVWLNAESSLSYPIQFSDSIRRITLSGEAFFDITKNPQKPFVVESGEQRVTVIGTTFNVNAYKDATATITTLATGSIRIANLDGTVISDLRPGQQAVYTDNKFAVKSIDPIEFTSWKDGLFVLKDVDFLTVKRQLERWYDVEFIGVPKSQDTISAILSRDVNLSDLLQAMQGYTTIKFRIEGRTIMVE